MRASGGVDFFYTRFTGILFAPGIPAVAPTCALAGNHFFKPLSKGSGLTVRAPGKTGRAVRGVANAIRGPMAQSERK